MSEYVPSSGSDIKVGDILEVRSWQLMLVAGEKGLDRRVEWAHVFDVPDPSEWLDGGELVIMTGHHWPGVSTAQSALIRALHEAGACALALGMLTPRLTQEAIDCAAELNFPLLRVPRETGYLSLVKFVAAANGGNLHKTLVNSLRVFESLTPTPDEMDTVERFGDLERITGYRLTIVSGRGKPLFEGFESISPKQMEHVLKTSSGSDNWKSLAIPNGYAAPLVIGRRLAGFLVAEEPNDAGPVSYSVFRAVETVARLQVGGLYRARESTRRHRAELLSRYLYLGRPKTGAPMTVGPEAVGPLVAPGSYVLAAIRSNGESPGAMSIDDEIHHGLADENVWNLLVEDRDRIIAVLQSTATESLGEVVSALPVQVGLSSDFASIADSSSAHRQAVWALEYGQPVSVDGKLRMYSSADADWAQWLPSDPVALAQLVKQTLGDLLEYDRRRKSELTRSLRVYFDEDCRLQAAATRLFIHKHTLAYRLKRVEELTGRRLSALPDRSVLWLAVSALSVVSSFPEFGDLP